MNIGFYQSVGAMRALQQQQELVTGNLARQAVSGHRQVVGSFVADPAPLPPALPPDPALVLAGRPDPFGLRIESGLDFTPGALEPTGQPLHLALEGRGFFAVRDPAGTPAYTRNGAFARAADGSLRTPEGATLLDPAGQPLVLERADGVEVLPDGTIRLDGIAVGQVGQAVFADPSADLREVRPGFLQPREGAAPPAPPGPDDRVRSGLLERSNVQPLTQLTTLVAAVRAYEANQRALSAQDEATSRLLRVAGPSA